MGKWLWKRGLLQQVSMGSVHGQGRHICQRSFALLTCPSNPPWSAGLCLQDWPAEGTRISRQRSIGTKWSTRSDALTWTWKMPFFLEEPAQTPTDLHNGSPLGRLELKRRGIEQKRAQDLWPAHRRCRWCWSLQTTSLRQLAKACSRLRQGISRKPKSIAFQSYKHVETLADKAETKLLARMRNVSANTCKSYTWTDTCRFAVGKNTYMRNTPEKVGLKRSGHWQCYPETTVMRTHHICQEHRLIMGNHTVR